jgi:hypothetical protein
LSLFTIINYIEKKTYILKNNNYIAGMMTGVDLPNEDEKPEGLLNE